MGAKIEDFGGYGFVNGLGLHGDQSERAKLLRSLHRAVDRGDWPCVARIATAYGFGAFVGSEVRKLFIAPRDPPE
jgi:hypothetical protein